MTLRKTCPATGGLILRLFFFSCCLFCMTACDGIGSSRRGDFPTYPGVSDSPSGTSSGSNSYGIFGPGMSGGDLFSLANSGDIAAITEALSETTTISFSSSAIGLSAGGSVTLTITGNGIAYTAEASDAGDGFVYFTIPKIANGTVITVSIIVRNQDGSVACAGSETQTVTNNAHDIHVSLIGGSEEPWALPASIPVSAGPVSITYNNASPQDVTFSVAGLTPPPSGTLTYSWAKSDGTPLPGTGSSVTVSLTDLLPPSPSAGTAGCSVTVTATYTDADGNVSTATGTGVVSVTVLEIPSFTVTIAAPAGVSLHTGTTDEYDVADRTQQFTFTATPAAGTAFPDDAVFEWTINGITQSGTTASILASPDEFNCSSLITTSAMVNTVRCNVSSPKSVNSPRNVNGPDLKLRKTDVPTPVIDRPTYSETTYIGYDAATSTYSFYAIATAADPLGTSITFSLTNESSFPIGTTYEWKLNGVSMWGSDAGARPTGTVLGAITGFSMSSGSGSFTVTCEATKDGTTKTSDPITVKILPYPSSVPDFYVWIDPYPGGQNPALSGGTVYIHGVENSTIGVRVGKTDAYGTVELPASGSFATFKWMVSDGGSAVEVKSGGNQDDTFTLGEALVKLGKTITDVPVWDGTGTAPAGGLTITVSCKISLVGSSLPEKSSNNSYPHDTVNYFTIYRDP